jgi:hypothetical protein
MSKKCYEPVETPGRDDCPYELDEIQGKECLSDSIDVINNNYFVLDQASCELTPEALKKLKIKNQGQFFPTNPDTFVLNFSGEGVNMQDEGFLKTVLIPFSGVRGIIAGRNVLLSATGIAGGHVDEPYKRVVPGELAEGDVIINAYLPASPRQARLFFYYGANSASNPFAGNWVQKSPSLENRIPSAATIQSFVNTRLGIPAIDNLDPLFSGGDVWVIYQMNGYTTSLRQSGIGNRINLGFTYTVTIIGGGAQNGSGNFTAGDRTNDDYTADSITNFVVYRLTRERTLPNGAVEAGYTVRETKYLQNLSSLSTTWLPIPAGWSQFN